MNTSNHGTEITQRVAADRPVVPRGGGQYSSHQKNRGDLCEFGGLNMNRSDADQLRTESSGSDQAHCDQTEHRDP